MSSRRIALQLRAAALLGASTMLGCADATPPAPRSAPLLTSSPDGGASAAASGDSPSTASRPECHSVCSSRFQCLGDVPVDICEANCNNLNIAARGNPLCSAPATKYVKCLSALDCASWTDLVTGPASGHTNYPCADEELGISLYCSGTPEAVSCFKNCVAQIQCDNQGELDMCGRACMRDLHKQSIQFGVPCWSANVILNICKQPLSCTERRTAGVPGGGRPCSNEATTVLAKCR